MSVLYYKGNKYPDGTSLADLISSEIENRSDKVPTSAQLYSVNTQVEANTTNLSRMKIRNENLFDNAWFTVSQAGYNQPHGSNKYACDRWAKTNGITSVSYSDGLVLTSSEGDENIFQRVEPSRLVNGEIIILSTIINGVFYKTNPITITLDGVGRNVSLLDTSEYRFFYRSYISNGYIEFKLVKKEAWSGDVVKAVKLEKGSVSTIANDVKPDYATELLKCQRYFQTIGFGGCAGQSNGNGEFRIIVPVAPMRTKPAFNLVNETTRYKAVQYDGTALTINSISLVGIYGNYAIFAVFATGANGNKTYSFLQYSGSLSTLIADL